MRERKREREMDREWKGEREGDREGEREGERERVEARGYIIAPWRDWTGWIGYAAVWPPEWSKGHWSHCPSHLTSWI